MSITPSTAEMNRRPHLIRKMYWAVPLIVTVVFAGFCIRPVRIRYHLSRGAHALAQLKFEEALAEFRQVQSIDPKNPESAFWLARICRKTGDSAGVRKYLEEAAQLGYPDHKRLEREWWLALAESGRIKEAEPHLADMLIDPGEDGSEICDAFSKSYCRAMRFAEAGRLLDAWEAEFPKDYRPHLRRAQILEGEERWASAIPVLRRALKLAPDEFLVLRELGRCLMKNEEVAEAVVQLQAANRRNPDDITSLSLLAENSFDQKDHLKALEYLNQIIAQQPQAFPTRLLLAKVHLALGDPDKSISTAEQLVAEWPEDINSQYILAKALRAAKRHDEAQRHFLIHGELQKHIAEMETYSREVKKHPSDPQLRYELGKLLLNHISRPEGVAYLESVFQYDPAHHESHQLLAEYYRKVGNQALAAQHESFAKSVESSVSAPGSSSSGVH